ncbi:MAG: pyridoxamine 5'-phosphate oxidase [Ignavibacteria bacterium]
MNKKVADIRKDYLFDKSNNLIEKEILTDPIRQFEKWFNDAVVSENMDANAMSLATSTKNGVPSLRTVLLKGFDEHGFVFYTNYSSRKGNEMDENPNASILFFWKDLGRQVRIEGVVVRVSAKESDEYFLSRPYESRISAAASDQSKVIKDREILDGRYDELKEKYKDGVVPRPSNWGGYRLIPSKIEFWQGRQNRLHDRILFTREKDNWKVNRLAP